MGAAVKPVVSPVAAFAAMAINKLSSDPQEGAALGGLAFDASPDAVAPSGGVVPCQLVTRIVCHIPVVLVDAVYVGVVPASEPSAIL